MFKRYQRVNILPQLNCVVHNMVHGDTGVRVTISIPGEKEKFWAIIPTFMVEAVDDSDPYPHYYQGIHLYRFDGPGLRVMQKSAITGKWQEYAFAYTNEEEFLDAHNKCVRIYDD